MVNKGNLWFVHAMVLMIGRFFRFFFFLRWLDQVGSGATTSPRIRKPTISNEESVMLTSVAEARASESEPSRIRREMQMLGQYPFSLYFIWPFHILGNIRYQQLWKIMRLKTKNRTRKYIITRTWPKIVHHLRSPIIYATLEDSGFGHHFWKGLHFCIKCCFRNGPFSMATSLGGSPTLTIQAGLVPTRDDEFDANEDQHDPNPIPPRSGPTCWREKHMKKSSLNPRNHPKSFHRGLFNH